MTLAKKIDRKYTIVDYMGWPDDGRLELIDGNAYNMTPAPTFRHQQIVGAFFRILANKLAGKSCVAAISPIDVVLSSSDVVQPDIVVVCDKKKITEANIQGAPDTIVEVLSPSTALRDKREKKALYEKYGVREYIIVDPLENYLEHHVLKDGSYGIAEVFGPADVIVLQSLEVVEIRLSEIFELEEKKENNREDRH